jgi:hypothetical protein
LPQILDNLPPNTDASSLKLSNKPIGLRLEEERHLKDLKTVCIQDVGLRSVSSIYLQSDLELTWGAVTVTSSILVTQKLHNSQTDM